MGIRPEDISLAPPNQVNPPGSALPCQIAVVEPMGSMNVIVVYVGGQQITVTTEPDLIFRSGEQATLSFNPAKVHFFQPNSDENLTL